MIKNVVIVVILVQKNSNNSNNNNYINKNNNINYEKIHISNNLTLLLYFYVRTDPLR